MARINNCHILWERCIHAWKNIKKIWEAANYELAREQHNKKCIFSAIIVHKSYLGLFIAIINKIHWKILPKKSGRENMPEKIVVKKYVGKNAELKNAHWRLEGTSENCKKWINFYFMYIIGKMNNWQQFFSPLSLFTNVQCKESALNLHFYSTIYPNIISCHWIGIFGFLKKLYKCFHFIKKISACRRHIIWWSWSKIENVLWNASKSHP